MKRTQKLALVVVLLVIAGIAVAKWAAQTPAGADGDQGAVCVVPTPPAGGEAETSAQEEPAPTNAEPPTEEQPAPADEEPPDGKGLPKLLELGSVGCIPCEHMAPIIDALEKELAGKVFVKFYDVNENTAIAEQYEIMTIPTQVFLDADGKELFRHIGVFEKDEILAKLQELGMLKE